MKLALLSNCLIWIARGKYRKSFRRFLVFLVNFSFSSLTVKIFEIKSQLNLRELELGLLYILSIGYAYEKWRKGE